MVLTLELILVLLLVLALGFWGVWTGIRQSREQSRKAVRGSVTAQDLSALAQPYRGYLGEALAIKQDVARQAAEAPASLSYELARLAQRLEFLVARALPRAQHGTRLSEYLLELTPDEAQYPTTKAAAEQVAADLASFVGTLRTLRGKVYQVLTDATQLGVDQQLGRDLDDALIEVSALEEAFRDVRLEA